MDTITVDSLGIVALLVLIFMSMSIDITLVAVDFFGFATVTSFKIVILVLSIVLPTQVDSYSMIVVPLSIPMGGFVYRARLLSNLFDFTKR